MYSKFQKFIIEELEELGEVAFAFIIPYFLKSERNIKLKSPIFEHAENYFISDGDFKIVQNQVLELFSDKGLSLYKYKENIRGQVIAKWEDGFTELTNEECEDVLRLKENWLNGKGNPAYFIAEKGVK